MAETYCEMYIINLRNCEYTNFFHWTMIMGGKATKHLKSTFVKDDWKDYILEKNTSLLGWYLFRRYKCKLFIYHRPFIRPFIGAP